MAESYQEQVARLRQQRAVQERNQRVQEIRNEGQQALQFRQDVEQRAANAVTPEERAELAAEWHAWDREVQQLERDFQAHMPIQQQIDPQGYARAFLARRQTYIDKYGQAAVNAIAEADKYCTTPRNPRNLKQHGLGLQRYTPTYYRRMDDLLDMYAGQLFNAPYSSDSDKALTPDEAAKASGLSNRDYNRSVRALQAQGRLGREQIRKYLGWK